LEFSRASLRSRSTASCSRKSRSSASPACCVCSCSRRSLDTFRSVCICCWHDRTSARSLSSSIPCCFTSSCRSFSAAGAPLSSSAALEFSRASLRSRSTASCSRKSRSSASPACCVCSCSRRSLDTFRSVCICCWHDRTSARSLSSSIPCCFTSSCSSFSAAGAGAAFIAGADPRSGKAVEPSSWRVFASTASQSMSNEDGPDSVHEMSWADCSCCSRTRPHCRHAARKRCDKPSTATSAPGLVGKLLDTPTYATASTPLLTAMASEPRAAAKIASCCLSVVTMLFWSASRASAADKDAALPAAAAAVHSARCWLSSAIASCSCIDRCSRRS